MAVCSGVKVGIPFVGGNEGEQTKCSLYSRIAAAAFGAIALLVGALALANVPGICALGVIGGSVLSALGGLVFLAALFVRKVQATSSNPPEQSPTVSPVSPLAQTPTADLEPANPQQPSVGESDAAARGSQVRMKTPESPLQHAVVIQQPHPQHIVFPQTSPPPAPAPNPPSLFAQAINSPLRENLEAPITLGDILHLEETIQELVREYGASNLNTLLDRCYGDNPGVNQKVREMALPADEEKRKEYLFMIFGNSDQVAALPAATIKEFDSVQWELFTYHFTRLPEEREGLTEQIKEAISKHQGKEGFALWFTMKNYPHRYLTVAQLREIRPRDVPAPVSEGGIPMQHFLDMEKWLGELREVAGNVKSLNGNLATNYTQDVMTRLSQLHISLADTGDKQLIRLLFQSETDLAKLTFEDVEGFSDAELDLLTFRFSNLGRMSRINERTLGWLLRGATKLKGDKLVTWIEEQPCRLLCFVPDGPKLKYLRAKETVNTEILDCLYPFSEEERPFQTEQTKKAISGPMSGELLNKCANLWSSKTKLFAESVLAERSSNSGDGS